MTVHYLKIKLTPSRVQARKVRNIYIATCTTTHARTAIGHQLLGNGPRNTHSCQQKTMFSVWSVQND
jgi:hypothetical protein